MRTNPCVSSVVGLADNVFHKFNKKQDRVAMTSLNIDITQWKCCSHIKQEDGMHALAVELTPKFSFFRKSDMLMFAL